MSVGYRKKRIDQVVKMLKSAKVKVTTQTNLKGETLDIRYIHMSTFIAMASYEIGVTQGKIAEYLLVLQGIGLVQLNTPHGMITLEGELIKGVK